MKGSTVCYYHGGPSLKGTAHPNFKDGHTSKYLPARLQATYEEMMADPDILTLRREVGIIRTRLAELQGKLDAGGGASAIHAIR
jgi:hypothetical protein